MEKTISINSNEMAIREYNGQRVVMFKDIDTVHGRKDGTAHRNFKANRNRFIEGVDYFRRNSSEAKEEFGITAPNGLILITESGYLMLAKSFTDDLAWTVQRELVNNYFRVKELPKNEPPHPRKPTLDELLAALNVFQYMRWLQIDTAQDTRSEKLPLLVDYANRETKFCEKAIKEIASYIRW